MKSEYWKIAQLEYKSWNDWVGKGIYWELFKKLKIDRTTTYSVSKSESFQEKETHEFHLDFEI